MAPRHEALLRAGGVMQQAESVLDACAGKGKELSLEQLCEVDVLLRSARDVLTSVSTDKDMHRDADDVGCSRQDRVEGTKDSTRGEVTESDKTNQDEHLNLATALRQSWERLHALESRKDDAFMRSHEARAEAVVLDHVRRADYKTARETLVKFTEEMGK